MGEVIKNRYEFVVLFDVENGNPNGDPDAGNIEILKSVRKPPEFIGNDPQGVFGE